MQGSIVKEVIFHFCREVLPILQWTKSSLYPNSNVWKMFHSWKTPRPTLPLNHSVISSRLNSLKALLVLPLTIFIGLAQEVGSGAPHNIWLSPLRHLLLLLLLLLYGPLLLAHIWIWCWITFLCFMLTGETERERRQYSIPLAMVATHLSAQHFFFRHNTDVVVVFFL